MAYNREIYMKLKDYGFQTNIRKNMANHPEHAQKVMDLIDRGVPVDLVQITSNRKEYFKENKKTGEFEFKNWQKEKKARYQYVKENDTTRFGLTKEEINKGISKDKSWEDVSDKAKNINELIDVDKRNGDWSLYSGVRGAFPREVLGEARTMNVLNGYGINDHFGFAVAHLMYTEGYTEEEAIEEVKKLVADNVKYD